MAEEASGPKKAARRALAHAVALAAIMSVDSPFVHIDGIAVRAPRPFKPYVLDPKNPSKT